MALRSVPIALNNISIKGKYAYGKKCIGKLMCFTLYKPSSASWKSKMIFLKSFRKGRHIPLPL